MALRTAERLRSWEVTTPEDLRAAFSRVLTDRLLLLRAVCDPDVDAAFAIHGDPRTYEFHPAGVAASRAQSAAQIERWERAWQHGDSASGR